MAYTPQQNGVAEKRNKDLNNSARCMLQAAKLSKIYWTEAVSVAAYVQNRLPTKKLIGLTPFEAWTGRKPDLSYLKVFGCVAYAHVPAERRQKWDPKGRRLTFVGYADGIKGYKLIDPIVRKVTYARNVIFREDLMWSALRGSNDQLELGKDTDVSSYPEEVETFIPSYPAGQSDMSSPRRQQPSPTAAANPPDLGGGVDSGEGDLSSPQERQQQPDNQLQPDNQQQLDNAPAPATPVEPSSPQYENQPRRSQRIRQPRELWKEPPLTYDHARQLAAETKAAADEAQRGSDPQSYDEALSGSNPAGWKEAINRELDSLLKNKTWELVPLPEGRKPISTKWVFRTKFKADGSLEKLKVRLVVKGFSQKPGEDYLETLSPVVCLSSVRHLIAVAAQEDLDIHQMDVQSAFLHGTIEEKIYMELPQGYDPRPGNEHLVCKLKKALYGLKQSPNKWFECIRDYLIACGFEQNPSDTNVSILRDSQGFVLLALYVDDTILVSNSPETLQKAKDILSTRFSMTDMGELHSFLGMRITRDRTEGTITLSQEKYVQQVLRKFHMESAKPSATPMSTSARLVALPTPLSAEDLQLMEQIPYKNACGSLQHLQILTHLDISKAVSQVCQYFQAYGNEHWTAVKRVLRYLKGTASYGLIYKAERVPGRSVTKLQLTAYSDSDWAGDLEKRCSTAGYAVVAASAAISWSSKRLQTICLSSAEAEYSAEAARRLQKMWCAFVSLRRDYGCSMIKLQSYIQTHSPLSHSARTRYSIRGRSTWS